MRWNARSPGRYSSLHERSSSTVRRAPSPSLSGREKSGAGVKNQLPRPGAPSPDTPITALSAAERTSLPGSPGFGVKSVAASVPLGKKPVGAGRDRAAAEQVHVGERARARDPRPNFEPVVLADDRQAGAVPRGRAALDLDRPALDAARRRRASRRPRRCGRGRRAARAAPTPRRRSTRASRTMPSSSSRYAESRSCDVHERFRLLTETHAVDRQLGGDRAPGASARCRPGR